MASKLSVVLLMLVLAQVCLSFRLPREAEKKVDTSSSSEESEDFDKIKAKFEELLTTNEKSEFNKIVEEVNAAKTLEQSLDATMKMISFAAGAAQKHVDDELAKSSSTAQPDAVAENKI